MSHNQFEPTCCHRITSIVRCFLTGLLCLFPAAGIFAKGVKKDTVTVSTTVKNHRCRVGDRIEFRIQATHKNPIKVTLSLDGQKILHEEEVVAPAKLTRIAAEPGFIRCTARLNEEVALCGVGIEPEKLHPYIKKPDDFDSFWDHALAEFQKIPIDLKVAPCKAYSGFDIFRMDCANVNGKRAYGMLAIPRDRRGKKVPLVVCFGGGEAYISETGFRKAVVNINQKLQRPCAVLYFHLPPYSPVFNHKDARKRHTEFLKKEVGLDRYIFAHMDDREKYYGYSALAGCLRLLRSAAEYPEIDRTNIVYTGSSHGGTFGIYLAACSDLLKAAFCGVPSFCDYAAFTGGRKTVQIKGSEEYWKTFLYFDCAYFAERIKIPIFCSVGYIDVSCPPSGVYAMYNQLRCSKKMYDKILHGHGDGPAGYDQEIWDWLKKQLDRK